MNPLQLQRIGKNSWDYTAYKDQNGNYYLDTENRANPSQLYTVSPADDIDGDPCTLITDKQFHILNPYTSRENREKAYQFQYMMLSRLKEEAKNYLTTIEAIKKSPEEFYPMPRLIYSDNIQDTVKQIKRLYAEIPQDLKPQWLTPTDIEKFEQQAAKLN